MNDCCLSQGSSAPHNVNKQTMQGIPVEGVLLYWDIYSEKVAIGKHNST